MTRSLRAFAPLLALGVGLALVATLRPHSAAHAADTGSVIEVVQDTRVPGGLLERRTLIEADSASDAIATATALANDTGRVTAQFNNNPWKWPVGAMPVVVRVNSSLESPRPPLTPAVQNAVDQWSSVSPTTFKFVLGPSTSATAGLCDSDTHGNSQAHPDGINSISYTSSLPSNILGLTCSYQPDDSPNVQTEFDTELNYSTNWGSGTITSQQYDLWSTVLHEMGHAAGIGHSCVSQSSPSCTAAAMAAVMFPALARNQIKRTLADDDKAALQAQYPLSGPTLPPPPPTPTPPPVFDHNFAIKVGAVARTE